MLRKLFCLAMPAVFMSMTLPVWAQTPGDYAAREKTAPGSVKKDIMHLREEAKKHKWTFEVGYTHAADHPLNTLAGLRVPANVAEERKDVNARGTLMLKADRDARAVFEQEHPKAKLPGRLIEARNKPSSVASAKAFDWVKLNKVTGVRDQSACGSCWDFAAIGAFECSYLIRNNTKIDASEQEILDCANAGSCAGGWYMGVFDHLIKVGTCSEATYPYKHVKGPCKKVTHPYRAVAWAYVASGGATPSVAAMKNALLMHGPLAVAVNATPAFQHYTHGVFNEHNTGPINHAVLVVGWDDTKGKGAWLVKNSWSTAWGDHGYIWIEYGSNRIGDHAAWVEARNMFFAMHADYFKLMPNIAPHSTPMKLSAGN